MRIQSVSLCFLGGFGLLVSDGPGGNRHCRVNGNAVIQQGSDNLFGEVMDLVGSKGEMLLLAEYFTAAPYVGR